MMRTGAVFRNRGNGRRNPLRAGPVARAEDWPESSLHGRARGASPAWLADGPVPPPRGWPAFVNAAATAGEEAAVRVCAERGRPYGDEAWTRGRPRRETRKSLKCTFDLHNIHNTGEGHQKCSENGVGIAPGTRRATGSGPTGSPSAEVRDERFDLHQQPLSRTRTPPKCRRPGALTGPR
jgi:hypothetical protein